jgi:hypothetical protein
MTERLKILGELLTITVASLPVLGAAIRYSSFLLTPAVSGTAELAAAASVPELAALAAVRLLPTIGLLLVVGVAYYISIGFPISPTYGARPGHVLVAAGLILAGLSPAMVLLPFNVALTIISLVSGVAFGVITAREGVWSATWGLPLAAAVLLLAALLNGTYYRGETATEFKFDGSRVDVVPGWYMRLAERDGFIYLLACPIGSTGPVAVPIDAVSSIQYPVSSGVSKLEAPSLVGAQLGNEHFGLDPRCPSR